MLHQELTHPEVLAALAACSHGDSIAIVDSNYPAQSRRSRGVPLVSLNITHQVASTPLIVQLVARSLPIERCTLPVPAEEESKPSKRSVHEEIVQAVAGPNPSAEVQHVPPADFYDLTSLPGLALMIGTGDRRHYGSAILTVGYLPEPVRGSGA